MHVPFLAQYTSHTQEISLASRNAQLVTLRLAMPNLLGHRPQHRHPLHAP